jgi:membrane protease YdiL (CAAX protease family)
MSTDRPDDADDIPTLHPLPPDDWHPDADPRAGAGDDRRGRRPPRDDYDVPPPRQGFGFWMSVVWCLLFFVVTQIVIGLACGIPIILVAVVVDQKGAPAPDKMNDLMKSDAVLLATLLTVMCSHIGGVLFGWLIMRWQLGRGWKRKIALTRRPSVTHMILTLIGLVAMLGVGAAVEVPIGKFVPSMEDIMKRVGFNFPVQGAEMIPELIKSAPLALALFTVGLLPAFDEEFWCRGFIANGLSHRYAAWAVVGITSFLFGLLHVDPRQGLGAMFLGLAMHGAYLAARSLWVPMTLHFLNNGLAVLHFSGGKFPVLQPLEDTLTASPALFTAGALLLFAAVAYAFYQTRCKLVPVDPDLPTWEPPSKSGVELPPPGSGTVVAHDRLSPASVALVLVGALAFGLVLSFA